MAKEAAAGCFMGEQGRSLGVFSAAHLVLLPLIKGLVLGSAIFALSLVTHSISLEVGLVVAVSLPVSCSRDALVCPPEADDTHFSCRSFPFGQTASEHS